MLVVLLVLLLAPHWTALRPLGSAGSPGEVRRRRRAIPQATGRQERQLLVPCPQRSQEFPGRTPRSERDEGGRCVQYYYSTVQYCTVQYSIVQYTTSLVYSTLSSASAEPEAVETSVRAVCRKERGYPRSPHPLMNRKRLEEECLSRRGSLPVCPGTPSACFPSLHVGQEHCVLLRTIPGAGGTKEQEQPRNFKAFLNRKTVVCRMSRMLQGQSQQAGTVETSREKGSRQEIMKKDIAQVGMPPSSTTLCPLCSQKPHGQET